MNPKTISAFTAKLFIVAASALAIASPAAHAQNTDSKSKSRVLAGPAQAKLKNIAEVAVPAGFVFLDGDTTRAMMKKSGQPVSGNELGFLSPTNEDWSVIFEFSDVGYVKDDDKDKLDADKLLADIKRGTAEGNKERVKAGQPPLEVVGWEMPPKYDATTHNLEWAIRATSENRPILNYNTRLLGRKGVMEVVLIVEPDQLAKTLPTFRGLLADYSFQSGQSYAEYRSGDKVAKYGLAALVLGGTAVGAAKLGLFAWLAVFFKKAGKLIIVAFVAVAAFFKKMFAKLFGSKSQPGAGS
jgi:uncharacterized membrane-anchored protein